MKSNIFKKLSASLFSFTLLFNSTGLVSFASNNEDVKSYLVSDVDVIGKTSVNTSVYGYDLEDNMTVNSPIIDEVTIEDSRIAVSGYIDSNDTSTYFNLSGRVTNDSYVSSKFKCYQTYWTFDITKKNAWLGYSTDKSGEHLYCTSYFN